MSRHSFRIAEGKCAISDEPAEPAELWDLGFLTQSGSIYRKEEEVKYRGLISFGVWTWGFPSLNVIWSTGSLK